MQIIFKNKDKGSYNKRTSLMGSFICARRVSGCVEGEHYGGIGIRGSGI